MFWRREREKVCVCVCVEGEGGGVNVPSELLVVPALKFSILSHFLTVQHIGSSNLLSIGEL